MHVGMERKIIRLVGADVFELNGNTVSESAMGRNSHDQISNKRTQ